MDGAASHKRRLALVVGGTGQGIGAGIAAALARCGDVDVVVIGRDPGRGEMAISRLREICPSSQDSPAATFQFVSLDCYKLANVKTFCEKFKRDHPRLDFLVLAQGRAIFRQKDNGEGVDIKLAINYFSRVAFAVGLTECLDCSDDPRILTILSAGVHGPYRHYRDDFLLERHFSMKNAADAAGLYNDCGFDAIAREHPRWVVCHAAPGFVKTNWGLELPCCLRCCVTCVGGCAKSHEKAGELLSKALLGARFRGENGDGGFYTVGERSQNVSKTRIHDEAREVIWEATQRVLENTTVGSREAAEKEQKYFHS